MTDNFKSVERCTSQCDLCWAHIPHAVIIVMPGGVPQHVYWNFITASPVLPWCKTPGGNFETIKPNSPAYQRWTAFMRGLGTAVTAYHGEVDVVGSTPTAPVAKDMDLPGVKKTVVKRKPTTFARFIKTFKPTTNEPGSLFVEAGKAWHAMTAEEKAKYND